MVRPNQKECLRTLEKTIKLKHGQMMIRVRGDLTAIVCQDKLNANMLMNKHCPSGKCNFCAKHRNVLKLAAIQDYNTHVGAFGQMLHDQLFLHWNTDLEMDQKKKPFFHLLDATLLNSFVILTLSFLRD
jgi:hypothetical protein